MKKLFLILLSASVFLSACVKEEKAVPAVNPGIPEKETVTLFALGDNLLHMPVVNSGKKEDGSYDYSHIFRALQPEIKNADIAVIGQETVFAGKEYGYSGYPLFNSPSEMGDTLVKEGFDVILHASNHVMDKGTKGIENTLEFWDSHPEVSVLGINKSETEKERLKIIKVKGAEIALLNYTYGTNGIPVPQSKSYLVNLIDRDKIRRDSEFAEKHADFTVAFMHWGTEYSLKPDDSQKSLAKEMCEWGVDLIIGSHPHVIEPFEIIESENGNTAPVYYSLGNFVSRQLEAVNLLGGAAKVTLTFDGKHMKVEKAEFMPVVTHYNRAYRDFTVYPLKSYSDSLAAEHGVSAHDGAVSVERCRKITDKVFEGYDKSVIDY